jgi:hypothetical protein
MGTIRVVSEGLDGSRQVSSGYDVRFDVAPSLALRALRPTRKRFERLPNPCSEMVVPSTTEDTPIVLVVEALGLVPGTPDSPVDFTWSFTPDGLGLEASGGYSSEERPLKVIDRVSDGSLVSGLMDSSGCDGPTRGDAAWFDQLVDGICGEDDSDARQYIVEVSDGVAAPVDNLTKLRTQVLPDDVNDGHAQAVISVETTDAEGTTASLSFPLDVYRAYTVHRDASLDRVVEREPIVKLGEKISDPTQSTEVRFSEDQTETRAVDMGMSVNPGIRGSVGFIYMLDLALSPQADVRPTRTSAVDSRDTSQTVPAGTCVAFYRQAEKVRRFARVLRHGACGEEDYEGEVFIDDWQWFREIATAPSCPAPSTELNPPGPCEADCDLISAAPSVMGDFWN